MTGVPGCRSAVERKIVGNAIKRELMAALNGRGTHPLRWETDQKFYDNCPPKWNNAFFPGCEMLHFPLTRPRVNKLNGQTVRTLMAPDTALIGKMLNQPQRVEGVENLLQMFSEISGLEARLRQVAEIAGVTEHPILRCRFDAITSELEEGLPDGAVMMFGQLRYMGFVIDVIHPNDFAIYPNSPYGIPSAKTCGHRYWRTFGQIERQKKARRYFQDAEVIASNGPGLYTTGLSYQQTGQSHLYSDSDTQWVECWEVLTRRAILPGAKERRYLVRLDWNSAEVLSIEEFDLLPWYVRFGYLSRETDSFWSEKSVCRNIQGLQIAYNVLNNLYVYGLQYNALPAIIGDVGNEAQKILRYFSGDVIPTNGTSTPPVAITTQFRAQEIPYALQQIERLADQVTHVPSVATGGQMTPNSTAREVMAVTQGQAQSENDYLVTFGSPLAELWNIMREQLFHNFDVWAPILGQSSQVKDRNDLLQMIRWELHGRNPETTPEMELLKYEKLLEKAMIFGDVQGRIPGQGGGIDPETGAQTGPLIGPFDVMEILRSYVNRMGISNPEKVMPQMDAQNALTPEMGFDQGFMNQVIQMTQQAGYDPRQFSVA